MNTIRQTNLQRRRAFAALSTAAILAASFTVNDASAQTTTSVSTSTSIGGSFTNHLDSRDLDSLPAGVSIKSSSFGGPGGGGGGMVGANHKMMGHGLPLSKIVAYAYDTDAAKLVLPAGGLNDKYDVVVNVTDGGREKLQEELKNQFGITARRETRNADVLILGVSQPNASGLKPSASQTTSVTGGTRVSTSTSISNASSSNTRNSTGDNRHSGSMTAKGQNIAGLIKNLQAHFDKPIVDRTGLTGRYDVTLEWTTSADTTASEALKTALADQAGLSLTPSSEPMDVVVVEKK